ncbi:class II aldolase/adducin family protein [Microbacterium sp. NPDC019599]|uniref:class II aldolase/adducin family protein n=1 Tax=Microbacterium sp. NPDC019599 TaxID=3154690 RepID=UPI0033E9A3AA
MARTEDALQREQYVRSVKTEVAIARTRAEVAALSTELASDGIVGWGGGDLSVRVPRAELFVIKPPAGEHDDLAPENAIVCGLDGEPLPGTPGSERLPAADVAIHARLYGELPEIRAIIRSQSPHVLAHAATGDSIPALLAAQAERFGGGVPIIAPPLDDVASVAASVANALSGGVRVILVAGDGAYVTGASAREAVETARLLEQLARVAVLARADGAPASLPPSIVERLHAAFRERTAQTTDDRR